MSNLLDLIGFYSTAPIRDLLSPNGKCIKGLKVIVNLFKSPSRLIKSALHLAGKVMTVNGFVNNLLRGHYAGKCAN